MLYDIDLYKLAVFPNGEDPRGTDVQEHTRKRARNVVTFPNVFTVPLETLLYYGTRLGQRDVLHNMGNPHVCEECGVSYENVNDLKECDGSFPMNCGQSFPVNAYGKQLHCRRARIFNPINGAGGCLKKGPRAALGTWKRILQPRTKNKFYYLCSHCTRLSDDHLDVWGENIRAPGIDSAPNALAPTDVPFLDEHAVLSPHDEFRQGEKSRAHLLAETICSVTRRGGDLAVSAAASFMRLVRKICMPSEHQHVLLEHIDDEHQAAKRRYEAQFPLGSSPPFFGINPLPRKVETLKKAAAPTMITEMGIPYYRFRISIHNLKLRENVVDVFSARIAPLLQSMFLDPRFNHKEFFCQRNDVPRKYVHAETGETYFGPELQHGTRWSATGCRTC